VGWVTYGSSRYIWADICRISLQYPIPPAFQSSTLLLRCRHTLFHRPPLLLYNGGGRGGGDVDHGSPYFSQVAVARGCIDKNIRKNISPKLNFEVWKL